MKDWKTRPRLIEYWPDGIDYIMGMDESGASDLKSIERKVLKGEPVDPNTKDFTLTGVILDVERYTKLKVDFNELKYSFWEDGMCDYKGTSKRVCLHSREIRNKKYPFNTIDHNSFVIMLSKVIDETRATVISCYVDKEKHFNKYKKPDHPYHIAVRFILERYCEGLNKGNKNGIIILESRGKDEDKFVLEHIVEIVNNGTNKNNAEHFRNLKGVYFNPKWWANDNNRSSFVILELADLISFPIHKYARNNCTFSLKDQSFIVVEKKLYKYPIYSGWGLKIWP